MPKRHFVLIILSGLLIILLAACGAAQEGVTDSQSEAPETQQLVDHTAENEAASDENLLLSRDDAQPVEIERSSDVPELPFEDNADPALCGIPQQWSSDEPAYLSGIYEGELIQPTVFLYDSHLRREIVGQAPHGAEVKILLSQSNPSLDYFMVKVVNAETPTEGWIPAPFVSFELPPEAGEFAFIAPEPSGKSLQPQLAQADIDLDEVEALLPPDAIPAIDPDEVADIMVSAETAEQNGIDPDVRVIGVSINGESHAYPLPFMSRHEIVNAEIGGRHVATTW